VAERLTATVMSREDDGTRRYHLAKGPGDLDWQGIWCGGWVVFPGPRAHVAAEDVCEDCKVERRATARLAAAREAQR